MKIDTPLVKNKKYTDAIIPCIQKHSQEYRVLATLRYLYPTKYDAMIPGETPDLQDKTSSTGIEVTVAVNESDMKASRAFSRLNQGEPEDIEQCKKIIETSGYSFVPLKDERVGIIASGAADKEKSFIQESIQRKVKKIQQYRTYFKRVGLAVLLTEIPTPYAERHLHEWISEIFDGHVITFDFVYVISHRFCFYYNTHPNEFETSPLTKDESRYLATIGRMTAEGELLLTDEEWI